MDKYVKLKKIGEGSFGKALLVRSKESGKQMVVKEINMSKMGQKERVEARKETAVLAQLNHPNIVTYRESFEEIGNLYIVMDYCDGGDLYSRINQCRGILMQEDQILDWFVQICLSIKHIHDRKILHRDIKSQNIFLTKHGIVKLGDFGIAKVLNSTVELARTCIGTPYYLSPEIVENKPYNNKSDIWSLGCVLYEMTTLKHAFEAGNMKNLVLKIIRGSYPPVPPKYSYEIRNLIAQLFKRNARDRPSINAVLRKPLLQNRIKKFLTDNEYCDEFSHTVMHGQKIQKALPAGQKHAAPVRAVPVAAKKPPSTPRYNPASVYAPSVARRSRDAAPKVRKSSETRKSSDSGAARKSSEVKRPGGGVNSAQSELEKRRKELFQKEKARQEAARLREQQYARQHKELQDKQKMARMQKAREEGWRSLLDSDESAPSNRKAPSPKRDEPRRISPSPVPSKPSVQAGAPAGRDRGQYEHYHAFLDKLDQERKAAPVIRPTPLEPPGAHGAGAAVGGVAGALGYVPQYGGGEAARAAQHGQAAGARGADAANKAKILEEYLQRKREAAMNKARGVSERAGRPSSAQPGGNAGAAAAAAREGRPVSAREAHRKNQEEEYMARLKQIRLNNFNERRMQQAKENAAPQYKPPSGPDSKNDQDVRRRKIEALRRPPCPKRAQADERARRLKAELECKRREAYELEQQRLQAMAKARAAPVIPMTDAMKAIGAAQVTPPVVPSGEKPPIGMTAAMEAIGAGPSAIPEDTKSPLQKKKEEILKRLNSKPKVSKWGKPVEPISERPKWCEAGDSGDLSHMQLEETASHMEATSANDGVTRYGEKAAAVSESADQTPLSARRQWGGRAGTVLNVLQGADLTDVSDGRALALSAGSDSSSASLASPPPQLPAPGKASGIGSTITLDKKAPYKGTQVLTRASLPVVPLVPKGPEEAPTPREDPKKEEEAPKKLFDKVEFDEDEDDDTKQEQDDVVLEDLDDEEDEKKSAVVVKAGLRTGVFDVGDIKMLRTCSEPDLSKLFRTAVADNPFFKDEVHASLDLPSMDEDEEEDEEEGEDGEDMEDGQVQTEGEGQSEGREGDDEDDGSAGDLEDDDEDDLQTVRESMMSLLEDDDDEDNDSTLTAVSQKKKTKKTTKKTKSKFKKKKGKSFKDVDSSGEGDTSTGSSLLRSESAEDFVTMRETMRGILQSVTERPTKRRAETEAKAGAGAGAGDSQVSEKDDVEVTSTIVPGSESWQSDDDEEDYFEDDNDDMFSRLEEKRARLEQDLGCDTFLKAYKTVQKYQREKAIHEDEDENMEEGIRLVSRILGDDKSHLYPAILQLVMADGVFMEDNS